MKMHFDVHEIKDRLTAIKDRLALSNLQKKILFLTLGGVMLMLLTGVVFFLWFVVFHPGDEIKPGNIERILAIETPVFYNDGKTKIGVFFEDAHRQYLSYDEIPKDFVNSIVASEDNAFFSHYGISPLAILRAMVANFRAGGVVQGGSTITQQTAKNLFKRKNRSIASKLKELIYALRLEYHYPKEKILEFYVNQFFVSGNGRGLGVAARYYFDKSPEELNLLECAFIAGSVKKPNHYNPFVQKDEEAKKEALTRARMRTNYVLGQMYKMGTINAEQYQENLNAEIPFKKGKMTYKVNTIMDLAKEALSEPEVEEAMREHGIDNMATSGIRIITTVDPDLQESGFYAVRKELSRLDIRLLGYERDSIQESYGALPDNTEHHINKGDFLLGRIIEVKKNNNEPEIIVSLGKDETRIDPDGRIDKKGLMNVLIPLVKYKYQRWSEPRDRDMTGLLGQLQVGDLVYVSIRRQNPETGELLFDLEKYPTIQGALLSGQYGKIRTMVGGFDNKYYNRVIAAKRPMGSVIKPLVYCAALQLGWNTTDILNNERNIFVYQYMPYFPRPDHHSPYKRISMSWAGVKSENVATVWLLYHLCDRLNNSQFRELVDYYGLSRQSFESYAQYESRIRDQFGVQVNQGTISRLALEKAVAEIEADLVFDGKINEYEALRTFYYGDDFSRYLDENDALFDEYLDDNDLSKEVEAELRRDLLSRNFLHFKQLWKNMLQLKDEIDGDVSGLPQATRLYRKPATGQFVYLDQPPFEGGWRPVDRTEVKRLLEDMDGGEKEEFWNNVLIEGLLTSSTIKLLNEHINREYQKLSSIPGYSPEVLYNIKDFRVMVALRYLTGMSRALGIESDLDPVLSFPLGSNVINLIEVYRLYEAMTTGKRYFVGSQSSKEALMLIDRIEDVDGELIYAPERTEKQVLDPRTVVQLSDILKNVVDHGTGRYAADNVRIHSSDPEKEKQLREMDLGVTLLGKTGTANRFTNSAFAGIVPGVTEKGDGVSMDNAYVIASYVGFDDNTPMVRKDTHITGAGGALPIWSRLAQAVLYYKDYAGKIDLADLQFSGLSRVPYKYPDLGQVEVPVVVTSGALPEPTSSSNTKITTFGSIIANREWKPERYFRPYWQMGEFGK